MSIKMYQLLDNEVYNDNRGFAVQSLNIKKINSQIINDLDYFKVSSTFNSFSKKNVIRGLHYQQKPYNQIKIVTCIFGIIQVFVVNIDKNSHEYLTNYTIRLQESQKTIIVNNNCAFGFKVLSDFAIVNYLFDKVQQKSAQRVFSIFDKRLNLVDYDSNYILSNRDLII